MPDRLPSLIVARKTMATVTRWIESDDHFNFTVALDIDRVTQIGLRPRGKCCRDYADENVTFQIEYQFKGISKLVPVARIDWRPVKPHQNPNCGPMDMRLLRFHASHQHPFQENHDWMVGNGQPLADNIKLKNLPFAIPLETDPQNVSDLIGLMGKLFGIGGVGAIPAPPWKTPRLL